MLREENRENRPFSPSSRTFVLSAKIINRIDKENRSSSSDTTGKMAAAAAAVARGRDSAEVGPKERETER